MAAETLVQTHPALAGTDGDVVLGGDNTETGTTTIEMTSSVAGAYALAVKGDGDTNGIRAESDSSAGVYAIGPDTGVYAESSLSYGVQGHTTGSNAAGIYGECSSTATANGVFGHAQNPDGSGVYGQNDSTGFGVAGRANSGTGVLAESSGGTALQVNGKAQFSRSGIAVVPSGSNHVKVTLAGATTSSMILATVQQAGGFFVKYAVPASGSFTVYLNKAPASPATVQVAYFVLN